MISVKIHQTAEIELELAIQGKTERLGKNSHFSSFVSINASKPAKIMSTTTLMLSVMRTLSLPLSVSIPEIYISHDEHSNQRHLKADSNSFLAGCPRNLLLPSQTHHFENDRFFF